MTSRRQFIAAIAAAGAGASGGARAAPAPPRDAINVKTLGAFGDGKLPDLRLIREAIRIASERAGGATVYFPPGEYYLGAADETYLLHGKNLQNVRFVGDRATLSCKSVNGESSILVLAGSRDITIEGLAFRDYGLKRQINWLGATAVKLTEEGSRGCENIQIRDCTFDSVLSALQCRIYKGFAKTRGIRLTNLSVTRSYYGFNFQDSGDDVVGRGLKCNDVKRSYFPYGVLNHDIELDTSNNATGFTDVLIKCYKKETAGIRVKVKCRSKRSGDAIVALDQQHPKGQGMIRNITLELDIDDADCRLDSAILMRSLTPAGRTEAETTSRWDNISIDGDVRICDKTKLIEIETAGRTPGRLHLGEKLSKHPGLPRNFKGFTVSRA